MTLLKVFFVALIAYYVLRASRNLMLAAQSESQTGARQRSSDAEDSDEEQEDRRLPRHHAPHEVVEDAKWQDL